MMYDVRCTMMYDQGEAVGKCTESQRGAKDPSPAKREKDPRPTARYDVYCFALRSYAMLCSAISYALLCYALLCFAISYALLCFALLCYKLCFAISCALL